MRSRKSFANNFSNTHSTQTRYASLFFILSRDYPLVTCWWFEFPASIPCISKELFHQLATHTVATLASAAIQWWKVDKKWQQWGVLMPQKWFSTRVSGSFSLCEALQCRDGITDVLGLCCGQGKWDKYSLCSGFFGFSVFRLQRFLLVFYYRCAGATWAAFRGAFGPLVVADFGKLQTLSLIETRTSSRDMPASLRPVHYALSFRLNVIFLLNSDFRQAWLYDGKRYAKICRIILR